MHAGFWRGNLKESDRLEDLRVVGRITLKWIMKPNRTWTGFIWFMAWTSGELV